MKCFLRFDADGRIIGKQRRTGDQLPAIELDEQGAALPYPDFIGEEITAPDFIKYQDHDRWWRDAGEIKPRTKIAIPLPARQRLAAQPAILWERVPGDAGAAGWQPGAVVSVDAIVSIKPYLAYQCKKAGVTGLVPPEWGADTVWEPMPAVKWARTRRAVAGGEQGWQAYSIYAAGELVLFGGIIWRAMAAGVSAARRPAFAGAGEGAELSDRDELSIPLPDLGGHKVIMKIAGERHELTERVDVFKPEPGMITVELDSPGFYSDPYFIIVETQD